MVFEITRPRAMTKREADRINREADEIESGIRGDAVVNYGTQTNNNGTGKVVWWLMGGLMTLQIGIGVAAVTFVGSALYSMNARLAVVESRLQQCAKP